MSHSLCFLQRAHAAHRTPDKPSQLQGYRCSNRSTPYPGPGLLESNYHSCLCRELELRNVHHESEVELPLEYKGVRIKKGYVIDLLIEHSLLVEIKSVEKLLPIHSSQLLTYMRLRLIEIGLLINFNVQALFDGVRRLLL